MPSDSPNSYGGLTFFMTNALLKQDLRTLINSHLFCVDNLSDAEIRERLTRDGNPVGYEGQHILGYHYGSPILTRRRGYTPKSFARVNMFGDLVVGSGEETCLVCIKHGRLSVTRQVGNDVVSVHDKRLLVCL